LIPASTETRGHATLVNATFYAEQLGAFMQATGPH
jgi:homoserine O-acetyltransferase